jgi:hypothetical protein
MAKQVLSATASPNRKRASPFRDAACDKSNKRSKTQRQQCNDDADKENVVVALTSPSTASSTSSSASSPGSPPVICMSLSSFLSTDTLGM